MITSKSPDDWKGLQVEVGRLLKECGFSIEIEKTVKTARGEVQLDVWAHEYVKGRKYSIVCECKHWKKRVPQHVVHSFRTVVADLGANVGYIISLAGFQKGAFKARELTNVELVSWQEFQIKFELSWYESFFSPQIAERLYALIRFAEPLYPDWLTKLSESQQQRYCRLKVEYEQFGSLVMRYTPYHRVLNNRPPTTLPLIDHVTPSYSVDKVPKSLLDQTFYREFFEEAVAYGTEAVNAFQELRDAALGNES